MDDAEQIRDAVERAAERIAVGNGPMESIAEQLGVSVSAVVLLIQMTRSIAEELATAKVVSGDPIAQEGYRVATFAAVFIGLARELPGESDRDPDAPLFEAPKLDERMRKGKSPRGS